jgi:hypothetical protein
MAKEWWEEEDPEVDNKYAGQQSPILTLTGAQQVIDTPSVQEQIGQQLAALAAQSVAARAGGGPVVPTPAPPVESPAITLPGVQQVLGTPSVQDQIGQQLQQLSAATVAQRAGGDGPTLLPAPSRPQPTLLIEGDIPESALRSPRPIYDTEDLLLNPPIPGPLGFQPLPEPPDTDGAATYRRQLDAGRPLEEIQREIGQRATERMWAGNMLLPGQEPSFTREA